MAAVVDKKRLNSGPTHSLRAGLNSIALWIAVLLAHLPLGAIYCSWLWSFDHYRFFPILFLGLSWLVWSRADFTRAPGKLAGDFGWLLLGLSLLMLGIGAIAVSPWMGWLAFVLACGSFLVRLTDKETNGSLLYLWIPIWLTLRLPLGRDMTAIHAMQSFTSKVSSRLLDAVGCIHLMSGNVLELPEKRLLVEEACSGVQSLFTMLFLASVYCVIERRTLLRTIGLLTAAVFWTLFLNVIRVVTIALANSWFGIDLSGGWIHEVLGFAILGLAFLMLLSSDRLLFFFLRPIPDAARDYQLINPLVSTTNWVVNFGSGRSSLNGTDQVEENDKTPNGRFRLMVGIPLLAFAAIGMFQVVMVFGSPDDSISKATNIVRLSETTLDDPKQRWKTTHFRTQTRGSGAAWGPYSDIWTAAQGSRSYYVDFSYPFAGWHDVTVCYEGDGWEIQTRKVVKTDEWPFVVATMSKPTGESGCVVFSAFRHTGEAVAPGTEFRGGVTDRTRKAMYNWKRLMQPEWNSTYQAQAFFASDNAIDELDIEQTIELHLQTRVRIRDGFLNANSGADS